MSTADWVSLPEDCQLTVTRADDGVVVTAAFPTAAHLAEALGSLLLLTAGLALALYAGAVRRGTTSFAPSSAMLLAAVALALALYAWRRLRAVRPYRLRFDARSITADAPIGVPLTTAEADAPRRARGGRLTLTLTEISKIDAGAHGVVISGQRHDLLVPWRFRKALGLRPSSALAATVPAFRFDELDWIAALAERLRGGDRQALTDLLGARNGAAPATPPEEPTFVLRGLGPARLHVLVVVVAAGLALLIGSSIGVRP